MKRLSATIITLNEEDKIRPCLESLKEIADEIVVVDSLSTDSTKAICEEFEVRFVEQKWLGYSEQKNLANRIATYDWILSVDADEAISEELKMSILKIKESDTDNNVVFSFNRLNNYCGKWIHHSGFYPDKKIRIWNRNIGKWEGLIHEVIKFDRKVKEQHLKGDLLHFSYSKPEDFEKQLFKFAEMRALHYFEKGKKNASLLSIISPIYYFIQHYIIRLGFLDGKEGLTMCMVGAKATRHKYRKLKEIQKLRNSEFIENK